MPQPKAYDPIQDQKYQILFKNRNDREWEHLDYAKDKAEKFYLLGEYGMVYGMSFHFKTILLPKKYWEVVKQDDTQT